MMHQRGVWFTIGFLLYICGQSSSAEVTNLLSVERKPLRYVPLPHQRQLEIVTLFKKTLELQNKRNIDSEFRKTQESWQRIGFQLDKTELTEGDEVWLIRESSSVSGQGVYAIRAAPKKQVMISAPHSFFDKHTGEICETMFRDRFFSVAAWNTAHRREVDVARVREHPFGRLTSAFIECNESCRVVQLHGFAKSKRETAEAQKADIIVSSGRMLPSIWAIRTAAKLRQNVPEFTTKLFPDEVRELGATSNAQGRVLREMGSDGYLSLELSRQLRERLKDDQLACRNLIQNLSLYFREELP